MPRFIASHRLLLQSRQCRDGAKVSLGASGLVSSTIIGMWRADDCVHHSWLQLVAVHPC
ncbi:hypothetical protein CGRA01v4_00626 [Colletotrichum graminicola]|nr:hypothetical protein CGRA01v4_00626 [Colletotrichum graminicola]